MIQGEVDSRRPRHPHHVSACDVVLGSPFEPSRKLAVDKTILSQLPRIIFAHTAPQEYSLFVAHLSNASEVQKILQWMKELEGVREVRSTIEVEHIHVQDWLEGEIEKRLSTRAN